MFVPQYTAMLCSTALGGTLVFGDRASCSTISTHRSRSAADCASVWPAPSIVFPQRTMRVSTTASTAPVFEKDIDPSQPAGSQSRNSWSSRRQEMISVTHCSRHGSVRAFWLFVVAFNLVGTVDLVRDYYHAIHAGLPALAGQSAPHTRSRSFYVPA